MDRGPRSLQGCDDVSVAREGRRVLGLGLVDAGRPEVPRIVGQVRQADPHVEHRLPDRLRPQDARLPGTLVSVSERRDRLGSRREALRVAEMGQRDRRGAHEGAVAARVTGTRVQVRSGRRHAGADAVRRPAERAPARLLGGCRLTERGEDGAGLVAEIRMVGFVPATPGPCPAPPPRGSARSWPCHRSTPPERSCPDRRRPSPDRRDRLRHIRTRTPRRGRPPPQSLGRHRTRGQSAHS